MKSSSVCEQCGKKFKVFAKRKKCMHCMIVVCKYCYAPHVEAKHPSAAVRLGGGGTMQQAAGRRSLGGSGIGSNGSMGGRATIAAASELHGDGHQDEDDVHFLSPVNLQGKRMDYDDDDDADLLFDGVEDVEIVSGGDDDDDDDDDEGEEEDDDDEEDDEPYSRELDEDEDGDDARSSMEEESSQFSEFLQLQDAVATWAKKEKEVKKKQQIAKRDSCYSMKAIPDVRSTREYQERELFVVSYSIGVTILVWLLYAFGYFAYTYARSGIVRMLTCVG